MPWVSSPCGRFVEPAVRVAFARAAVAIVVMLDLALAGCGGGSPAAPSRNPTTSDRSAIVLQVTAAALGGVAVASLGQSSGDAPIEALACQQSCSGTTCNVSCPIDERFDCPQGGSATDQGQVTGTLDAERSGEATLDAMQTYTRCRPRPELTIDGAPGTRATGSVRFVKGRPAEEKSLRVVGAVQFESPDRSGRCEVDLRVTLSDSRHGTARGTACGEAVDTAF